ncbi:MAG: cupin domain-containing protein [Acidobacteriaceae bacterium]|nr:cupin domain-containing protein [Acidobacteriaceae bacterium]
MSELTAARVKELLGLKPHPREGGWFHRTYESAEHITLDRYPGPRFTSTAIFYLLEPDTFSEMHMLESDEIFHHYLGSPVEMLQLHPNGNSTRHLIGKDIEHGEQPQLVVPRGVWQGSHLLRPAQPNAFALLGCTVSPGFEFEDYSSGAYDELIARWPQEPELLRALTQR